MTGLEQRVKELGPWYHRIDLGDGVYTKPEGFDPESKWRVLSANLPDDLSGKNVLEIGCSSAYYSVKMAQLGGSCHAFDQFESAIRQAQFLAEHFGVTIDASVASVYDIHRFAVRHYDYVIFLGVLYHLRYPMLALDMIADLDFDTMFLQTITYEDASAAKEYTEYIDGQKDRIFTNADFPTLKFVEHTIRSDHSSWYNFNSSAVEAMMRAAGLVNVRQIAKEYWRGEKGTRPANGEIEYRDLVRALTSGGAARSDSEHHALVHDRFQALQNKVARLEHANDLLRSQLGPQ